MSIKAYSKAAKRRAKKALPKLAPIEKPQQHRVAGKFARDDDPRKTALTARQRRMGGKGSLDDANAPMLTSELGCIIASKLKRDEAAQLWSLWQQYSMAERTYRIRYIGTTGDPQGAAIQMVPEPMQSDQSASVDMRSQDERDRDAVNNWMRWQGHLGCLTAHQASALRQAERGNGKLLWDEGIATNAGLYTFDALLALADVVG